MYNIKNCIILIRCVAVSDFMLVINRRWPEMEIKNIFKFTSKSNLAFPCHKHNTFNSFAVNVLARSLDRG